MNVEGCKNIAFGADLAQERGPDLQALSYLITALCVAWSSLGFSLSFQVLEPQV